MKALKLAGLIIASAIILLGCDNGGKKRGSTNPYGYNNYSYNQNCEFRNGQWVDRATGQIRHDCQNNVNNGYNCQQQVYDRNMCHRYVGPHWVDIQGRPVPQHINCNQQCNGNTQFNGLYPHNNWADECTYTYGQGSQRVVMNGRLYCTSPYYYSMYNLSGSAYLYSDYSGYSRCRLRHRQLGPFYYQYYYCY